MREPQLSVAVPWSLTHYIPLNGFHPLYRGLFQAKPPWVRLSAWDNIKLSQRLRSDEAFQARILNEIAADAEALRPKSDSRIEKDHSAHFWTPNRTLTRLLPGDIEFHHTAPFPSLERPFVLHCESFAPVFFPFAHQGTGRLGAAKQLRAYYRSIFEHPLCLGIFSHLPQTLRELSLFFDSPAIDAKLFSSRIGLYGGESGPSAPEKGPLSAPLFLFINSAHQNPGNFFLRGGHVVLRFWRHAYPEPGAARLILRCRRPSDALLREHGVDVEWLRRHERHSVIWIENYLRDGELDNLMRAAHFFLLPSASLHSVSIMQAMAAGAVPVVSDTMGTDRYVADGVDGIRLTGVYDCNWRQDSESGVMIDSYERNPALEEALVRQLLTRIGELTSEPGKYAAHQARAQDKARVEFSGQRFSDDFWQQVRQLHAALPEGARSPRGRRQPAAPPCMIDEKDWTRIFTSSPQPFFRLHAGHMRVAELGGSFICLPGSCAVGVHDWSPLAEHVEASAPSLTFAADFKDLGGRYLSCRISEPLTSPHRVIELIAKGLSPYPHLFAIASKSLQLLRRLRRAARPRPRVSAPPSVFETDIELVMQNVRGLNIIRCCHLFYAIPQSGGEFSKARADAGGYAVCVTGTRLEEVLRKIDETPGLQPQGDVVLIEEGVHGFKIIRCGATFYAIPEKEGVFDPQRMQANGYRHFYAGESADAVRAAVVVEEA